MGPGRIRPPERTSGAHLSRCAHDAPAVGRHLSFPQLPGDVPRSRNPRPWPRQYAVIDPAGQEAVDFVHSTDELLMFLGGELELAEEVRCPALGGEMVIPARASHTW